MTSPLAVAYAEGTHRSAILSDTLTRISPLLGPLGITRAGDITGLDRLGIPTWFAVRPYAKMLQVSNGKGLSHESARVSALMESIEHWHAEWPDQTFRRASTSELVREDSAFLAPTESEEHCPGLHFTEERIIDWAHAELLQGGMAAWVPACTAFVLEPFMTLFSASGLAAGNHLTEATLHALYEVIERDSVARLSQGGLSLPKGQSRVIDLVTLPSGLVADLRDRIWRAQAHLTLIRVESIAPVHTFWAFVVDPASPFPCTSVNMGHGSHLCPVVAALRAITEAAQSRLTFIHGSREDLRTGSYQISSAHDRLRRFLLSQTGDLSWNTLADGSSSDLSQDLETVLRGLHAAGYTRVFRVDLTQPRFGIPVVKVSVPGLRKLPW